MQSYWMQGSLSKIVKENRAVIKEWERREEQISIISSVVHRTCIDNRSVEGIESRRYRVLIKSRQDIDRQYIHSALAAQCLNEKKKN